MHERRRLFRIAAAICLGLPLTAALVACDAVGDADMERLKEDIAATFRRRQQTVTEFRLTRDSRYQVSGMIYVQIQYSDGPRTFYTPCIANMDPKTRKFTWQCEKVP